MAAFSLNYGVFFPGKIYVERYIYFKMLSKNLHPRPFNVPNGNGTLVGIFRSPPFVLFWKNTPTSFPLGPRNVGNIESLKYVSMYLQVFEKLGQNMHLLHK